MAITITSKPKVKPPSQDLLAELGLGKKVHHEPPPQDYDLSIVAGSKVEVNHSLFPHIKDYSKGDTGTVIKVTPPLIGWKDKHRYDILDVRLDSPSETGKEVIAVSRWELTLVGAH